MRPANITRIRRRQPQRTGVYDDDVPKADAARSVAVAIVGIVALLSEERAGRDEGARPRGEEERSPPPPMILGSEQRPGTEAPHQLRRHCRRRIFLWRVPRRQQLPAQTSLLPQRRHRTHGVSRIGMRQGQGLPTPPRVPHDFTNVARGPHARLRSLRDPRRGHGLRSGQRGRSIGVVRRQDALYQGGCAPACVPPDYPERSNCPGEPRCVTTKDGSGCTPACKEEQRATERIPAPTERSASSCRSRTRPRCASTRSARTASGAKAAAHGTECLAETNAKTERTTFACHPKCDPAAAACPADFIWSPESDSEHCRRGCTPGQASGCATASAARGRRELATSGTAPPPEDLLSGPRCESVTGTVDSRGGDADDAPPIANVSEKLARDLW